MKSRFCCFTLLLLAISCLALAKSKEDSLWNAYQKTNTPSQKATILLDIADEHDLRNDLKSRDSLFDLALEDIQIKTQDSLLVKVYNWYFDKEEEFFTDGTVEYAKNFSALTKKHNNNIWHSYAHRAKAKSLLFQYKNQEAYEAASQSFYYASLTSDPETKVKAMLLLGYCLEKNNKKIEAFRNYTDALYLSRTTENEHLIYLSYQNLASFYYLIFNIEKAKDYINAQYKILSSEKHIDSLAIVKLDIINALYLFENNEQHAAEKIVKRVLNYTTRHNYERLTQTIFVAYRTYLINNSLFKELSDLYTKQYPEALNEMAQSNPNLYLRVKGFISEANGQMDSAEHYYVLAEENIKQATKGNIYTSNFYKRYGEFLVRRNKMSAAEEKLKLAFEFAEKAQYIPYLTELSKELDSLSYSQGKIDEAYKYAKLSLQYGKQAELVHQEEELLKLEVENEARERELTAQREQEATERRHNIQYMGISILIVLTFIILAMLGSLKVPKVVVKALGFFSFIFLFEFIIMLADHKIHHFTHGEPWKFMIFKIILIAVLLPLHHWLEEKVIHYLVNHKLIDTSRVTLKTYVLNLFRRKKHTTPEGIKVPAHKKATKKPAHTKPPHTEH